MSEAKLFTPNTERGGETRYKLYQHSEHMFSALPDGPTFRAYVERDACGLGCYCGAYLFVTSKRGRAILAKAKKINSMSEEIT